MDQRQVAEPAAAGGRELAEPLLRAAGVCRSFGETRALLEADLVVAPGEVHALAGENGSGKTTLIKVLSGVLAPDEGALRWDGRPVAIPTPRVAQRLGLVTVFQETLYAAEQSVVDNVAMGMDRVFRRAHRREDERRRAREALALLGESDLELDRPLWSLSLAERQLVTIARAIVRPWRLLILDEGTSALDASQRDRLFGYLRDQRAAGRSVLFTSHRMDEIETLADTVSVLRLGGTVLRTPTRETTSRRILAAMAGREAGERAGSPAPGERARAVGAPAIAVDRAVPSPAVGAPGAGDGSVVTGAETLTVHRGEILGLAGLEGQGQAEFARALAGLGRPAAGRVYAYLPDGRTREVRSYGDARRLGIAYVPVDRKHEGLFFTRSTLDNFGIALLPEVARAGLVARSALRRRYEEYVQVVRLVAHDPSDLVGTLSGGNQQKVLLARWLATRPNVLVLNDPMRGVDANTKEELYALLRRLAAEGLAIVLLSTELLELLTLCDRIAVFHGGGVNRVLEAGTSNQTDLVAAMFGHELKEGDAR